MLAQHLGEIRGLRQRLERSIATNDELRVKLEQRLRQSDPNSSEHGKEKSSVRSKKQTNKHLLSTLASFSVSANIYLTADDEKRREDERKLLEKLATTEAENLKLKEELAAQDADHKGMICWVLSAKLGTHKLVVWQNQGFSNTTPWKDLERMTCKWTHES